VPVLTVGEAFQMEENAARAVLSPEECRRFERNLHLAREGRPTRPVATEPDPYDIRENLTDKVAGKDRRIDDWRQVLEYHGFAYYPPLELDRRFGMLEQEVPGANGERVIARFLHQEGEWRRVRPPRRSFTTKDVVTLFASPLEFDTWMRGELLKHRRTWGQIRVVRR
jgi:hypothetical protein